MPGLFGIYRNQVCRDYLAKFCDTVANLLLGVYQEISYVSEIRELGRSAGRSSLLFLILRVLTQLPRNSNHSSAQRCCTTGTYRGC